MTGAWYDQSRNGQGVTVPARSAEEAGSVMRARLPGCRDVRILDVQPTSLPGAWWVLFDCAQEQKP